MASRKKKEETPAGAIFDVGGVQIPDFDPAVFDFVGGEDGEFNEETRYTKPKVYQLKSSYVNYDNAVKLARDLRLDPGERADCFVGGNFIFGDFIEAYLTTHRAKVRKLTISTLSLGQNNVDSLYNLLNGGFIDELNLVLSVYFWGNEHHRLIPYIYKRLDTGNRFQLAVASIHTKTAQFETYGGRKIVIHGSANLRSSGNVEQFTIEENPDLYDFYDEYLGRIIEKYSTIKKPIRDKDLWAEFIQKKFND